jgi:hypothetical protein
VYQRVYLFIYLIFFAALSFAQGNYQIDLIIFLHTPVPNASLPSPQAPPNSSRASIPNLLPLSSSALQHDYYALAHSANETPIMHASWIQSSAHQQPRYLELENNAWAIKGLVRVHQGHYYQINNQFLITSLENPNNAFLIRQKQRLKNNTVYYLDSHPVGVLIKVHSA